MASQASLSFLLFLSSSWPITFASVDQDSESLCTLQLPRARGEQQAPCPPTTTTTTGCPAVTSDYCLGDGLAYAAGDRPDGVGNVYTPVQLTSERVKQVVGGDQCSLVVLANGSTRIWGTPYGTAANWSLEMDGVHRAMLLQNSGFYQLTNGSFFGFGDNDDGQLGLGPIGNGTLEFYESPVLIPALEGLDVKTMAAGEDHALFVLPNGSVLGTGYNSNGQLGLGAGAPSYVRTLTRLPVENVVTAACGDYQSYLVLENGSVLVAGTATHGMLGLPDCNALDGVDVETFVINPFLQNVVQVASGVYHALFLLKNGSVLGVGSNARMQMTSQVSNTPGCSRGKVFVPALLPVQNVKSAQAGGNGFSIFTLCNGSQLVTGRNEDGQLGLGSNVSETDLTQGPFGTNVACSSVQTRADNSMWLVR